MKNKYLDLIEKNLAEMLPSENCTEANVIKSIRYSLLAGGKRIRPTLLLAFNEIFGGDTQTALPFACAVEMIHTYSLIHDDLPCMDNDDLRRGKPSNHVVFGEDVALLAGDALQSLAFSSMLSADVLKKSGINGAIAAGFLANASGATGMVGGQVIDLETENKNPDIEAILEMYSKKTGALIKVSCEMGAALCGVYDDPNVKTYAENIGLAKVNYVTKTGISESKKLVEKLTKSAIDALEQIPADTQFLQELAEQLAHRIK